jgi:5-methylcytosine-specific restriction endonuclease McrA
MLVSCSRCGKLHPRGYKCNKGRAQRVDQEAYKLRSSWAWQKKSKVIKDKSKWLCAVCKDDGKLVYDALEVHHIVKVTDDKSKAFDDYNLICLCVDHHKLADAGKIKASYLLELAKRRENNPPV